MQFEKFGDTYVIVLARGELVMECLARLTESEAIDGGVFVGLGAVDEAELAVYDVPNQEYHKQSLQGVFEVTNLTGTVGMRESERIVHGHITLSDTEMVARGGHLVEAKVSGTMEIVLTVLPRLDKQHDDKTGLNVFRLGQRMG